MSEEQIQSEATKRGRWATSQSAILLCLFMPGIVLSGFISHRSGYAFSIVGATVIVLAGLASILPFKGSSVLMLQKLVCLYLVFVLVERASVQYIAVAVHGYSIKFSYGVAIVALCLAGAVTARFTAGMKTNTGNTKNRLIGAWALALGIIVAHMLLLLGLLRWKYGYGYDRDPAVLGHVSLCLLLYLLLWRPLTHRALRVGIALVFVVGVLNTGK